MRLFRRYLAVGLVATVVHYALLVVLVQGHVTSARLAAGLGAWLGAQVAYAGNARYTFAGATPSLGSWLRFQLTAVIGAGISYAIVGAAVALGLHYLLAQFVATAVTVSITYAINKRWSFRGG
ncbi:MAG: GtrA family protein [Caldimonas sp.]